MRRRWLAAAVAALCAVLAAGCLSVCGSWAESATRDSIHTKNGTTVPFYLENAGLYFVTKTGYCYHYGVGCDQSKYIRYINPLEAVRLGYRPCSKCDPLLPYDIAAPVPLPDEIMDVFIVVEDPFYHSDEHCPAMDLEGKKYTHCPVVATLQEARYLFKEPCVVCCPPDTPP